MMSASHHIASKFESFSKRISSPKCWRFTPARSSFARPGPVDPKVRSVRRSDGSTEWWPGHRPSPRRRELSRATSSRWCSQILQGGARKRRYSRCRCTDPRRLKTLARSTQELLATAPHIKHAAQLIVLPGSPANRKLDHPNDASRRSLHRLGVAHRCCTQSQDCFVRVLQSRPKAS